MGSCCQKRQCQPMIDQCRDDQDVHLPPSSAAQRRRTGVTTTSLTQEELEFYARDGSKPTRARHATEELLRRRG